MITFPTKINLYKREYLVFEASLLAEKIVVPRTVDFIVKYPLTNSLTVTLTEEWTLEKILFAFREIYKEIYAQEDFDEKNSSLVEADCPSCRIPALEFYRDDFSFEREDETPCCICISERMSSKIVLKCGHKYHFKCIERWFKKSNKCPLCNGIIKPCGICESKRLVEIRLSHNAIRRANGLSRLPTEGKYGIGPVYYEDLVFEGIIVDDYAIHLI